MQSRRMGPWLYSAQHALSPASTFHQIGRKNILRMCAPYLRNFGITYCMDSNELIRTFIMDGNFSAEHMRYRTTDKEVSLSPGMAFMANPEIYKAHLRSGSEMHQAGRRFHFVYHSLTYSHRTVHAILIKLLNKPILVGHT